MNRNRWLILLGVALILLLCCCVAASAATGLLWWNVTATQEGPTFFPITQEPTPILDLVQRPPTPAERETAQLVRRTTIPPRDLFDLAYRLQGIPGPIDRLATGTPPSYEPGDQVVFWLHEVDTNFFFTTTAMLRFETPHAYWWVEEGYDIPTEDLEYSAWQFENHTYPTNHAYFGSEWDPGVDGDPHVYIFLGYVPSVGGYFSGPDEYPVQIRPHSNEHEMFYINLENARPGNDYFDGILAHEFQHMIHWAVDRDETTWVNEGLSELAAQVNGYDVGGSDFFFSVMPDTQLTAWPKIKDSAPHYGASYLFLAYFLERYGEEAIRQLVAEPANGIAGFDTVLSTVDASPRRFDDIYADWVIAKYLDNPRLAQGRYGYVDLEVKQPAHANYHAVYPVHEQATVHQYAADYILLEGQGDVTIEFTGSLVVPLVGNETHSGDYQWWSNRGDEGDATLTRAFDLSGLEKASLQVWMWYNLEAEYDYAYVEVSTDGGETWDILASGHTTTANPSGNSYGPAFTGLSGGGAQPVWVQEIFDLTAYAGQAVLIRFEVITDDSLNRPGLCLDDITIPELGYTYDVEADDGGWQAEGWVRITDHVPQEFLVQLITIGRETRVEQMALDERMHGTMSVVGLGQEVDGAVLVVSGMTPVTTEWAAYAYQITQQ